MKRNQISRNRRAVSLIELLVIMSAATIILTMTTGLIHRVMHAQSKARLLADVERTSLRLANTFRRDVHQAANAITDKAQLAGDLFLRLQLSGGSTLEYGRSEGIIRRTQVEGSRIVSREEFAFPAGIDLTIEAEKPRLIVLSITMQIRQTTDEIDSAAAIAYFVPADLQVAAALGQETPIAMAAPSERGAP